MWWSEAERHGVLPLDDRGIELFGAKFRDHSPHPADRHYVYRPPMSPIPAQASASIGGRSFDLKATVTRRPDDNGVLYATGTQNSGFSIFVQDGKLKADYNAFEDHVVVESSSPVPTGDSVLEARLRRTGGSVGTMELLIDGVSVGHAALPLYMRMISSIGASVGEDHGSAVSKSYEGPFPFSGVLRSIDIQLIERTAPEADAAEAASEMSRQ
ncbi:MAG: hypothetical protein R2706_05735 [Acidimicrobiales bacterium]